MFEYPRLLGTSRDENRIVVQTRLGTNLENFRGPEATHRCQNRFNVLIENHGQNWQQRKDAAGGYNCAGLVWASRRVALPNPDDWELILQEDGYKKLEDGGRPEIGDVVVYRQQDNHEILHVARICGIKKIHVTPTELSEKPIPWALSKWDLTLGESFHAIGDVYLNGGAGFVIEIYSERLK